jgi:DNA-binding NtrC family response regulator
MQLSALPARVLSARVTAGVDKDKSAVASTEALSVGTAADNDLVITDPTVSRYHVELSTGAHGVRVKDLGSTNGTFVSGVRVEQAYVSAGAEITVGDSRLEVSAGKDREVEIHAGDDFNGLKGRSPVMRQLMAQVDRVAKRDVSVLIHGESGTGKEVVARALHLASPRANGPFVTVDCGSLSPTLIASELFGHERGAFTGATHQHIGACERAGGGTLFLDEIGELPAALQSNLLGVLERRRLRRVGGRDDLAVDIRVVSATHHDLREEVNSGAFRLDLYYRLAVVVLKVPSLREHTADIPMLAEHFLRCAGSRDPLHTILTPEGLEALGLYRWPGNVRELRNLVEASLAMGEALALPRESGKGRPPLAGDIVAGVLDRSFKDARSTVIDAFEKRYFEALLARARGNISAAAREADIDRSHLTDLLKRHGIR